SNRSSVPEVVGDAGVLFDPDDRQSLAAGIDQIASGEARQKLILKGFQRAASYSWQSASSMYKSLYTELLDARR
ncbi:glycosyltransferase family 1 protein, partial [Burkholderiaceae bacterium]|nr:glycosyltransferase family 1 protein [Burkholderiaceae bacterium]